MQVYYYYVQFQTFNLQHFCYIKLKKGRGSQLITDSWNIPNVKCQIRLINFCSYHFFVSICTHTKHLNLKTNIKKSMYLSPLCSPPPSTSSTPSKSERGSGEGGGKWSKFLSSTMHEWPCAMFFIWVGVRIITIKLHHNLMLQFYINVQKFWLDNNHNTNSILSSVLHYRNFKLLLNIKIF